MERSGKARRSGPARDAKGGAQGTAAPQAHAHNLAMARALAKKAPSATTPGHGEPLSDAVQRDYGAFFDADLSRVRVHADPQAADDAAAIGAQAFTHENDIYFGHQRFDPGSAPGRRLLAHEIAHTLQAPAPTLRRDIESATGGVCREATATFPGAQPAASLLQLAPTQCVAPLPGGMQRPRMPVAVVFDEQTPWKIDVPSYAIFDASLELYGVDLSALFTTEPAAGTGDTRITLFTELLRPAHRERFHATMEERLDRDVGYVESVLMESWVDDDDEASIMRRVEWWSRCADIRDRSGVSYFDRFLGRLDSERYVTDYGVTESAAHSFLGLLHEEIEDSAGTLVDLIANHSERFGAYRPSVPVGRTQVPVDPGKSEDFVRRVAEQLLDRMVGFTSGSDEQGIVGMVTAMPPELQARVLRNLVTHTADRNWIGLSRTGEQTEAGMLYFLFEDLDEDDRKRMGASLVANGVLAADVVESLVERRTWAGRNLPWSTKKGAEAAQFWANEYVNTDSRAYGALSATMGGFASLWTPETAGTTIMVLTTANPEGAFGAVVSKLPTIVQEGLLVLGTGYGAYTATNATISAVSGRDEWGNPIGSAERVAHAIEAVSTVMMLGLGFKAASEMSAAEIGSELSIRSGPRIAPGQLPEPALPAVRPPVAGGEPNFSTRVVSETPQGDVTAVSINHETGEFATIRINRNTGDGFAFSPEQGYRAIVRGEIQPAGAQLPAPNRSLDLSPSPAPAPTAPFEAALPPLGPVQEPLALAPPAPRQLETPTPPRELAPPPEYTDISDALAEVIADIPSEVTWSVTPEGATFVTPPLLDAPLYSPTGALPPGQVYAGAGRPRPPMLAGPVQGEFTPFELFPGTSPTSRTLNQVRNVRGGGKQQGLAGERYTAESSGGTREVTRELPSGETRRVDVAEPSRVGTVNREAKNYRRYLGRGGDALEVQPTEFLRSEIRRDAELMTAHPDEHVVWDFVNAPPSDDLARLLIDNGIPYTVYADRLPFR